MEKMNSGPGRSVEVYIPKGVEVSKKVKEVLISIYEGALAAHGRKEEHFHPAPLMEDLNNEEMSYVVYLIEEGMDRMGVTSMSYDENDRMYLTLSDKD